MESAAREGFFEIINLYRDDITYVLDITDEQLSKITDDMMEEIAENMAIEYGNQLFGHSLRTIADKVLRKAGII